MKKPGRKQVARRMASGAVGAWLTGLWIVMAAGAWAQETAPKKALSFEELFGDPVIARGQGFEIKQSELSKAFTAYRSNLAAQGKTLNETERGLKEAQLLDRMIVTHLLTNQATRMDRTVATGMAERFYTETKAAAGSDEVFQRQLRLTGLTPEQFNNRIFEQALAESVLEREVESQLKVTEEEIEAFYREGADEITRAFQKDLDQISQDGGASANVSADDMTRMRTRMKEIKERNLNRLQQPEKVRAAHILLATIDRDTGTELSESEQAAKRAQAENLLQKAKSGEDFLQLVRQFSEDRRLQETQGIYTFARDEPYAPEFKAAAFSLKPGQISDIVKTAFGFHIIKLLEIVPPRTSTLEEVREDIQEFLTQQKLQLAMPRYFAELKKQANIEILDKRYRVSPTSASPLIPAP